MTWKDNSLRIITFNFSPIAYRLLAKWIHETNNEHVLTVTTPGPKSRPTPAYKDVIKAASGNLVTTHLKTVATPMIQALSPDLIICYSFPYRLTSEMISIPKIGAVNLHPTLLPAYRGPNIFRIFYDGADEYGVTLHWMAEDFDTGNILGQASAPMPEKINPEAIITDWFEKTAYSALIEGMEKVIAGDMGIAQNNSQATYAAPFTKEEEWLDWNESRRTLQLKHMALQMGESGGAKAYIRGKPYLIKNIEMPVSDQLSPQIGEIVFHENNWWYIQTGDGVLRIQVEALS